MFVWVTHQVAATRWLKAELAERAPHLRFAFARPGLTISASTARRPGAVTIPTACARVGRVAGPRPGARSWRRDAARRRCGCTCSSAIAPAGRRARSRRAGPGPRRSRRACARRRRGRSDDSALAPAIACSTIVRTATTPDEPWLIGAHDHDATHGPWPGGVTHAAARGASRAWCKIEEALRWADLEPAPGEIAVELGAAPGGASYAMLVRGVEVHGVDPGEIHPDVRGFAGPHGNRFVHHHLPAAEVPRGALPRRYQWLLNDVNLAPMVAMKYIERFVALAHGGLKGAVLTLKLRRRRRRRLRLRAHRQARRAPGADHPAAQPPQRGGGDPHLVARPPRGRISASVSAHSRSCDGRSSASGAGRRAVSWSK
jgi:23S rRNA (cytidine2498-2'-O)-methyltransferase